MQDVKDSVLDPEAVSTALGLFGANVGKGIEIKSRFIDRNTSSIFFFLSLMISLLKLYSLGY